ncbi:rhodanese-like domain-containing protein [Deinococcus rhizophilus]|uniref:rhodanese-like domain-containing protein n=1 Tax=Deinococcus rhizophilus TaxID=3049544 RepID=UPI0038996A52
MPQRQPQRPGQPICRSGSRSAQASRVLSDGGHRNLYNVDGGMLAWEAAGLPITR